MPSGLSPLASPPTRYQLRLAASLSALLVLALLVTAPYARQPAASTEALLPAYAAAVLVVELLTAALLMALFYVQRSRAMLLLAVGYLLSGVMAVPWALTFPGVFDALMLDGALQGTASIAAIRRLSFPLFVIAYAVLSDREFPSGSAPRIILGSIASVLAVVALATWFIVSHDDALPQFMVDAHNVSGLWRFVPAAAVALYGVGLIALGLRRRSMLDIWLMVVLFTLLIEILLISYISGGIRLSVGWWAGRFYGLTSASLVLLVLLSEATTVHARLARSVLAERRARQNRLTAMEALSASIAHEVNQPLASMVTNASAGLRWLERDQPHIDEAKAAFGRIVTEGHHASKVVTGIRTMFLKGAQERVPLDLNHLIDAVLTQCNDEARLGRISVSTALEADLPPVIGNPVQLRQVVTNLVDNAVDAMRGTAEPRFLRVTSQRHEFGEVLVAIADSGAGLAGVDKDRIFEPFFTTKPDGMGMGLMFCQSTIEAHGGRLWAVDDVPRGAIFRFTLPAPATAPRSSEPIR
ncbi:GHKL domain-containing protein [Bosea caraganae]|uniref:histidine kinase n=2 Tax=Bosea caraganae TaxID=2763117 RepID=A0A370LAB4_9HYPH|nr:GHKL domain-containing protein [Bosea caraganae]RDJ30809.1 GHKL domain-containing protein [Bosea caraganae]